MYFWEFLLRRHTCGDCLLNYAVFYWSRYDETASGEDACWIDSFVGIKCFPATFKAKSQYEWYQHLLPVIIRCVEKCTRWAALHRYSPGVISVIVAATFRADAADVVTEIVPGVIHGESSCTKHCLHDPYDWEWFEQIPLMPFTSVNLNRSSMSICISLTHYNIPFSSLTLWSQMPFDKGNNVILWGQWLYPDKQ